MKDKIQNYLTKYPQGLKASKLASLIGTDRKSVNSYLYGAEGRKLFEIDSNYVWRMKNSQTAKTTQTPVHTPPPTISVKKEVPKASAKVVSRPSTAPLPRAYRYLPKTKELLSRSVFWVYQNRTYYEEKIGGFLWSPKYTINGRRNPGYEAMKEVKPGDLIIHSYQSNIVAISEATSACISFDRPNSSFSDWDKDGWKIDCDYYEFPYELSTDSICDELYKLQPANGPLIAPKRGKQQYLCNASKRMLDCILNAYVSLRRKTQADNLLLFLQLEKYEVAPSDMTKSDIELFGELGVKKHDKTQIEDGCKVEAIILNTKRNTTLTIDTSKYPKQKPLLGKTVGEVFEIEGLDLKYQITKIWTE